MYCELPELGRCCFCLPLRKGVLLFGYAAILFNAFMIGVFSYAVHHARWTELMIYSRMLNFPTELCLTFHCAEVVFDAILIYGAHMKRATYIKAYYYYTLMSTVASSSLQVIDVISSAENYRMGNILELLTLIFAAMCMQFYLILIVRSLLKKMEKSGPHVYDNQLHQIVSGEFKVENNGVYNNTTAPTDV